MSNLKLHEKTFLEPKLLESLNLSFRVQADLNKYYENSNVSKAPPPPPLPNILSKRRASMAITIKRTNMSLKQVVAEPKIWQVVQKFVGYKLPLINMIDRKTVNMMDMPTTRDRFTSSDSFASESLVDIEAYRFEFKTLTKEISDLKAYLSTKAAHARHAGFPSKLKSTKHEYLSKVSDLRKTLRVPVQRRLDEVTEEIQRIRSLNEASQAQLLQFAADVDRVEKEHWAGLATEYDEEKLRSSEAVARSAEAQRLLIEERLGRGLREAEAALNSARKTVGGPSTRFKGAAAVDSADWPVSDTDTTFLSISLAQLDGHSRPLLDSYSDELRGSMGKCQDLARESVQRKHGSLEAVLRSSPSLGAVLSRLEELQAATQSFSRQQEAMRERLFDAHEAAVSRAGAHILQRRLLFLSRIKGKFDGLQRQQELQRQANSLVSPQSRRGRRQHHTQQTAAAAAAAQGILSSDGGGQQQGSPPRLSRLQ